MVRGASEKPPKRFHTARRLATSKSARTLAGHHVTCERPWEWAQLPCQGVSLALSKGLKKKTTFCEILQWANTTAKGSLVLPFQ